MASVAVRLGDKFEIELLPCQLERPRTSACCCQAAAMYGTSRPLRLLPPTSPYIAVAIFSKSTAPSLPVSTIACR
ncbi:hypothetical protein ACN38_g709 [Penicillium nordicum]|uniref:Uncharacterized protein n=1 Tax=Penicillium nordicum TaxID=229535 RepID=A0A0M8PCS9_9EURO|nr:hypothetical protein ACN38_g709 [Penicillium nordicum]